VNLFAYHFKMPTSDFALPEDIYGSRENASSALAA
jgi:hypothetical protein